MFEWDEAKRLRNLEKHGIDFWIVTRVFDGKPIVEVPARFNEEARMLTIAKVDDVFVTVVWTWRGTTRRIISARRSRRDEREIHRRLQS